MLRHVFDKYYVDVNIVLSLYYFIFLIRYGCVTGAVLSVVCMFAWRPLVAVGWRVGGICDDELFGNYTALVHPASAAV